MKKKSIYIFMNIISNWDLYFLFNILIFHFGAGRLFGAKDFLPRMPFSPMTHVADTIKLKKKISWFVHRHFQTIWRRPTPVAPSSSSVAATLLTMWPPCLVEDTVDALYLSSCSWFFHNNSKFLSNDSTATAVTTHPERPFQVLATLCERIFLLHY